MVHSAISLWRVNKALSSIPKRYLSEISSEDISKDVYSKNGNKAKSFDDIPGPPSKPLFGHFWNYLPFVGKYMGMTQEDIHIKLNQEYGNLVRLRDLKIRDDIVLCYDPKDIETVFRSEGPWPIRDMLNSIKYYRLTIRNDVFQGYGGVFTSDGEEWGKARSIANAAMMQPRTMKKYLAPLAEVSDDLVKRMRFLAAEDPHGDMPDTFINELHKWALESVGFLAFDTRLGMLEINIDASSNEQKFISDVLESFDLLYEIDILPNLSKYISTPKWRRYIKVLDRMTNFLLIKFNEAEEKLRSETKQNKLQQEISILERLLESGRKYAFGNIVDIFLGGVETTSRSMGAIMYNLSTHPEVQEKLRKEVLSILPTPDTNITNEKLEKMPYLRAVIKETMRKNPISAGITRKMTQDIVLSGYHIPKGTSVLIQQMVLLNSEKHFPNANKFIPERWLRNQRGQSPNYDPWTFLPFGFGPRSCVGKRLAQLELEVTLAKIIRNFRLEWHYQGEIKYDLKLLYGMKTPLKVRVIPL